MKKKKGLLSLITTVAAIAGGIALVASFLKKRSTFINDNLDFDEEAYFNEDDDFQSDEIEEVQIEEIDESETKKD